MLNPGSNLSEKGGLRGLTGIFFNKEKKKNDYENLINELYKQFGQLKVENDDCAACWLLNCMICGRRLI